jgi:hypothetical protein
VTDISFRVLHDQMGKRRSLEGQSGEGNANPGRPAQMEMELTRATSVRFMLSKKNQLGLGDGYWRS